MGIIGLGTIGSHTAKIANGFGMKIIAYNRSPKNVENVEMVSLDELFSRSDVVSLHTPFNDQSKAIINTESLQKMKPNCILINTARGGCVVSKDLADALKNKKIAGAGLDVLDSWDANNPLLNLPNVVITPHSAWFTEEALKNIADTMISNVQSFVNGDTINVVSG